MLNIDDNGLFEVFPMVETISNSFEYQNSTLNKIVLTGKINALEIAENLFNFTEQTAKTFAELQEKLIEQLLEENKKETLLKSKSKAKILLGLLNDSLILRGANIDVLAEDLKIKEFLKKNLSKEDIKNRLDSYKQKYTIFNEILILDKNGYIRANINPENRVRYTKDEILKEAKESDSFIQTFKKTDMFIKQKESLFFIKKIVDEGQILGFVVMFYDLLEEVKIIFDELITEKEIIVVVDRYNNVLAASEKGIEKNSVKKINKINQYMIVDGKFCYKTKLDTPDNIQDLYAIVMYPRAQDINIMAEFDNKNTTSRELSNINLKNPELKKLADEGYEILEDLSDVIINGELIAAKSKQYILIPILDNLREVSFRVVKLIELSISALQKVINASITNNVKLISEAISSMVIRSMYERGNDIRWFAKIEDFKDMSSNLLEKLQKLNNLYPMYSDIFIYDKEGKIVATSKSQHIVGQVIPHNYTMSNKDENKYFVTKFEETPLYNGKPTYIFYASILKDGEIVGGIGGVFDAYYQFEHILKSALDENIGIGLIVDVHRRIISSSIEDFKILDEFDLVEHENFKDGFTTDVTYDEKTYKLSISRAKKYREYENNELYSVIMVEK